MNNNQAGDLSRCITHEANDDWPVLPEDWRYAAHAANVGAERPDILRHLQRYLDHRPGTADSDVNALTIPETVPRWVLCDAMREINSLRRLLYLGTIPAEQVARHYLDAEKLHYRSSFSDFAHTKLTEVIRRARLDGYNEALVEKTAVKEKVVATRSDVEAVFRAIRTIR